MTRKVIKIGSSEGVTIPKEVMKELELKKGDDVYIYPEPYLDRFIVSTRKLKNWEKISKREREIYDFTKDFIDRYGDALRELAKK